MLKKVLPLAMVLMFAIFLAACGQAQDTEDEGANQPVDEGQGTQEPEESLNNSESDGIVPLGDISFLAGSQGGTYYILGSGMASLLQNHVPDTTVSVVASPGLSAENVLRVTNNEALLGLATTVTVFHAYEGTDDPVLNEQIPERRENIRVVLGNYPSEIHVMVKANSDIKSWEDMQGKKVNVGPPGSANTVLNLAMMEAHGFIENGDYEAHYLTTQEGLDALRDDTIDVNYVAAGSPIAGVQDLASTQDLRFIEPTPEAIDTMMERFSYATEATVPAGTYEGMDEDYTTAAMGSVIVTSVEAEQEQVYTVVKTFFDNIDEFHAVHPAAKGFNLDATLNNTFAPYHDGVIKYFDEEGIEYEQVE